MRTSLCRAPGEVRAAGLTVQTADALIAAVALANGFHVASRDTKPFEAAGVKVINPWEG